MARLSNYSFVAAHLVGGAASLFVTIQACAVPWLRPVSVLTCLSSAIAGCEFLRRCRHIPSEMESELISREKELEEKRLFLERVYEEKDQRLLSSIQSEQAWTQEVLKEGEEQLNQILENNKKYLLDEEKRIREEAEFEIKLREDAIANLQAQLQAATQLRRPKGTSRIEWVSGQVQDILLEYECAADYCDSYAHPEGQQDFIWFELRYGIPKYKCQRAIENLSHRLPGCFGAIADFEDGRVKITLQRVDASEFKAKKVKGVELDPTPQDWLLNAVKSCVDNSLPIWVNGNMGSGKSTVLNNIINLITQLSPDAEIFILDPKCPDSEWHINGVRCEPQYKGFTPWQNPKTGHLDPSALDGLLEMKASILKRLDDAMAERYAGIPAPPRNYKIWCCDEAEQLVGTFPKNKQNGEDNAVDPILTGIKVARSTKNILLMIGQSPMCSRYGLLQSDLNNFGLILYLGEQNAAGGSEEISLTRQQNARLKKQIAAYQHLAEQGEGNKYFGLVYLQGSAPFVAPMPRPNSYGVGGGVTSVLAAIPTPTNTEATPTNTLIQQGFHPNTNQHQPLLQTPVEVTNKVTPALINYVKACLNDGKNQTEIIKLVWGVTKGTSTKYQLAKQRYNEAIASLNSSQNDYHIDLTKLVKVGLSDCRLLPVRAGVYFVVDVNCKIYYIGSSKNIMMRWNYQGQSHHRMSQFEQINLSDPLYILSYPCDNYEDEEEHAIAYFKPLLNGTGTK
jgi:hypothetical protein